MERKNIFETVKEFLSNDNMVKVVKMINILIIVTFFFSGLREGILAYFVMAIYIVWFAFNILFFGIRKRYIECLSFVILLLLYLYTLSSFSIFVR